MYARLGMSDSINSQRSLVMGFAPAPTEIDFAERSARYLAHNGYKPAQIARALVDELNVSSHNATNIVSTIAA